MASTIEIHAVTSDLLHRPARASRHQCVQLLDQFELESGEVLRNLRQTYYLDGTLNAARDNLVVVFHPLTGSADAAGDWWQEMVGPERAIDTGRYAVLCTNLLGSCYGTTGPSDPSRHPFPAVTTRDMARLVGQLIASLHVTSVALAIGGSLGGMVALELAATFPGLTRAVAALAAPAELSAAGLAWNHLQRRAIVLAGDEGLELARMIAAMASRPVGELEPRREQLHAPFDAQCYLTLLHAMDTHDVGRGRGGVGAALRGASGRIVGVAIPGDLVCDPLLVRRWTEASGAEYRELPSARGHESFLTETTPVSSLVRELLADAPAAAREDARARAHGVETRPGDGVTADVVILGYGRIGRELATQLGAVAGHPTVRVVAVVDRTGYVLDPGGLSSAQLVALARAKASGTALADTPRGVRGSATDALAAVHHHAPTRPILVDVTAGDTGDELEAALAAGMDIVLANKRPLAAARGASGGLARSAAKRGRRMLHEATVGAGLPIIDTISKLQESGDQVLAIEGCPSGTLGYLFGELGRGTAFSAALRTAMSLGYTEPDPREDLSGMDVARKALILGRLLGFEGDLEAVEVESLVPPPLRDVGAAEFVTRLEELDALWRARVDAASASGRVLRYRATVSPASVRVGLTEVEASSPLATLTGTDNQFSITTTRYHDHPIVITGPGAGVAVTAAGVLNDVLKLARSR